MTQPEIQPYDDPQLVFFDADDYWRESQFVPEESQPEPELDFQAQLGWDKIQQGKIAEAEFVSEVVRLRGSYAVPNADPGGGIASDVFVTFGGQTITVQVKSAKLNANGRAQFNLGTRDGSLAGGRDTRRQMRSVSRAGFFALAVFDENDALSEWYLIPAAKLRGAVSLTVTPGRCGRRRKSGIEPERFRGTWERLINACSAIQVDSRTPSAIQVDSRR